MEFTLKVLFWIMVVQEVLRLFIIGAGNHPRKITLHGDIGNFLCNLGIAVWIGIVIWK